MNRSVIFKTSHPGAQDGRIHQSIEDRYPLSSLQQGMLFHSLDSRHSGVDVQQVVYHLDEELEVGHLLTAWQAAVARHAVMRTSFHADNAEPEQAVHRHAIMPVEQLDWTSYTQAEQERRWHLLLAEDRKRGFELSQVPLMRLTLIRFGAACYRMLWTLHHILFDGRSSMAVQVEVFDHYKALKMGAPCEFPERRPFRDYIDWLQTQDFAKHQRFWKEFLQGVRAPTPVTFAKASAAQDRSYGSIETQLSSEISTKLRTFAETHRLTVNSLVQGAWALLLHHYSGDSDIVFGATRANRYSSIAGAKDIIGPFINTLPMRVQIDPQAKLTDWLRGLRDQQLRLRDYEQTPLAAVQKCSELRDSMALFDSILVFDNQLINTALRSLGGDWLHRRVYNLGRTNYALTVAVYNEPELTIQIAYPRSRLSDRTAQGMGRHFRTLLEGMWVDPNRTITELPLLTDREKEELLNGNKQPKIKFAVDQCVHQLFEAQVERTPDNVAASCEGQNLSYRELNRRANLLAHRLRSAGVGPDVLVGLCAARSLDLIVGMLAILKAGGAYLPLDPRYPEERLQFMLDDAQAKVVLVQAGLDNLWLASATSTLLIDHADLAVSRGNSAQENNLVCETVPDSLAYVIYTSGSTGKPKGVLVTHYNVARLFRATEAWFAIDSRDVWTLFHSYAFDFSVWEIWGALLYGGKLVVVPYEVSRSPEEFAGLIKEHRVTVLNQTPSAFRQLMTPMIALVRPEEMSLRSVIFGGEALEFHTLKPWFDHYGDQRPQLINMYGITETTVHVTYRRVVKDDLDGGSSSIIGTAIPDLSLRVLNTHRQLVPVGVPGEIHVGGAGLARGYLRRAELTAEKFIDDPFSLDPGARLYRSGDLARWLPNGELEYLGRIDHQVKIRGFRVELGEIESVLNKQPGVKEAAVATREDTPGDKRLVAYFVAGAETSGEELRNRLRSLLPEHMVPAAFVQLESLPLTANGKLDLKALSAFDLVCSLPAQGYQPPRSEHEITLCEIWRNVLGVPRVGTDDNFFELGGDSILCIQVITRARQAGLMLSTRDLFMYPTVAALAALGSIRGVAAIDASQAQGAVLLTPIQHWFFEQNLAELHHWNQAFLFETSADIDVEILEAALEQLVAYHDSFRLRFTKGAQGWQQRYVGNVGRSVILRRDISALPCLAREHALTELTEDLQRSLDIVSGPLLGVAHARFDELSGRLLVVVHHLVVDGVSWRIFLEDLEAAYLTLRAGGTPVLPAKTSSFQAWSESLHEYVKSEALQQELDYWCDVARNAMVELPIDRHQHANLEGSAKTVTQRLTAEQTRRLLQQAPKKLRAQINEILLAALTMTFAGWAPGDSLLVDLEGHGREESNPDVDVSRTIGWFTSIAPVRLDLRLPDDLAARVRQAKSQLRTMPQHGLGYGVLRYLIKEERIRLAMEALPQARVAFNYLGQVDQWLAQSTLFQFAKEPSGSWHSPHAQRRYQFEIVCLVQDGCFEVRWIYGEQQYRTTTIESLADGFLTALERIIKGCEALGDRTLVPEDFPLSGLDQPALDRVIAEYGSIEDLFPLTPMQKLFHAMESAVGKLGLEQWHYILKGPLDTKAFKGAWERVVERHALLRSSPVSSGLPEPLLIVKPAVTIPWFEYDWRGLTSKEQEEKLVALLHADRDLGLELTTAPLLRLTLIRTADETFYFIWTTHHLLIDGWSWPLVFKDLTAAYETLRGGPSLAAVPACQYRDYVDWLGHRSNSDTERFWRQELSGIDRPTRFGLHCNTAPVASGSSSFREESGRLSERATASLQSVARSLKLTLNTLVQGAWALLLSHRSGERDVLFGAAFSGRPSELRGVEAMVGPCVNNLPVRVQIKPEAPLGDFLIALQEQQFAASQHQYCSLEDIQRWSSIPPRYRLFESLVVFQNYQTGSATHRLGTEVEILPLAMPETTNYPITLMVIPGRDLRIKMLFRTWEYANENMRRLLGELQLVLEVMSASPHFSVGELLQQLPELLPQRNRPAAEPAASRPPSSHASPPGCLTDTECWLATVWQGLFEIEPIDPEANFFDLGGHSLLMVQMHKLLCQRLGRTLAITKIFQYPTIRLLAKFLDGEVGEDSFHEQVKQRAQRLVFGRKPPAMRQPHGRA